MSKFEIGKTQEPKNFAIQSDSDLTEVGLQVRSRPLADAFKDRLPLARELRDINEHFGAEMAQTVVASVLERVAVYSGLIRRVRSFDLRSYLTQNESASARIAAADYEVTIVASQLPLNGRKWGDHVEQWRSWARELGFKTDVISTLPSNDIWQNAALISSHLLSNPHPRRILVTYGQGATEMRSLLTRRLGVRGSADTPETAGELDSIRLWINVAGAYNGAAIARYWKRSIVARAFLKLRLALDGRNANVVHQMDPKLTVFRAAPHFPKAMEVINVIGFPLRGQISLDMAPAFAALAKSSPNDGMVDLYAAIAHPGLIVPIPGMSQRAEFSKLEPVLKRVLAIYATDSAKDQSFRVVENLDSSQGEITP